MEELSKKMEIARKAYGISTVFMSDILGFGINQWRNYENGIKPNKSNYNLIRLAITPIGLKRILDISPKNIKEHKQFPKLYFKVSGMVYQIENDLRLIRDNANENFFNNWMPDKLI